ncbi:MAG: DUF3533 domain-containing protein [Candidatus Sericytochromatia bacterium]
MPIVEAQTTSSDGQPVLRRVKTVPPELRKAATVLATALVMASAFATTYTVALGRPFPRHLPIGVIGSASAAKAILAELQLQSHELDFRTYPSRDTAIAAVNQQKIPAVIDASATPPQLLVSSASDPSSARALTQLDQSTPGNYRIPIVDPHPLPPTDPAGLATFYVIIAATLLGFVTMFQLRANVKTLTLSRWLACVSALVVGAVSASLLPQPFAFLNHALPSRAAVSAIHSAAYFPHNQRALPFVVLGIWLAVTLGALLVSSRLLRRSPAQS